MQKIRNRLLIVLAFLTVATAAVWLDAEARPRLDRETDPGSSGTTVIKPGIAPSTGEPDGSGGPGIVPPAPPKLGLMPSQEESLGRWDTWHRSIRWAGRIWAARVLGVQL